VEQRLLAEPKMMALSAEDWLVFIQSLTTG
jgi:hypothetical protein